MAKKNVLGRGLGALIADAAEEPVTREIVVSAIQELNLADIRPNPFQPRTEFDEEALSELAASIKAIGIVQPITVRAVEEGKYEIIAGERRFRASKLAGLSTIPAYIRKTEDDSLLELALIENIQREDLNPIEEAQAYKRLLTEFHLKQDEVAERVSKSRAAVTNSIRLLKLNEEVQRMVVDEMISTGHARALLAVENPEEQYNLAQRIFDEKLSVRDVEKLVKNLHKPAKPKKTDDKTMQVIYQDIEEKLKQKLGRKVTVTSRGEGSGKIEIEFYNHEDLDRLLDVLNK